MNKLRKLLLAALCVPVAIVGGTAWANWRVESSTAARIYTAVDRTPMRRVGLVLGTTPKIHGIPNLFFERRLDAAAELYRAGKVRCLLVSGDHGTPYYNEVAAMRKGLMKRGVPDARIAMDHAGFRTLDSLVRARQVFGVKDAVIVSDGFHLPRALYLADQNGIDAVGLSSVPVPASVAPWPAVREVAARVLLLIDVHLIGRGPRFLGPHVPLPK